MTQANSDLLKHNYGIIVRNIVAQLLLCFIKQGKSSTLQYFSLILAYYFFVCTLEGFLNSIHYCNDFELKTLTSVTPVHQDHQQWPKKYEL